MQESTDPIKVIVVERKVLLRSAITSLLKKDAGAIQVVSEVSNECDLLEQTKTVQADVIVLHLQNDDPGMLDAISSLCNENQQPVILVITSDHQASRQNQEAIRRGASGIISMKESPATLLKAIQCLNKGELWLDRRTTALIFHQLRQQQSASESGNDPQSGEALTVREKEIISLIESGLNTDSIAEKLGISDEVVRNHLVSIYVKISYIYPTD